MKMTIFLKTILSFLLFYTCYVSVTNLLQFCYTSSMNFWGIGHSAIYIFNNNSFFKSKYVSFAGSFYVKQW